MQIQTICAPVGTHSPRRADKLYAAEALAALSFVDDCTHGPDPVPVELLTEAAAVVLQRPDVLSAALSMYLRNL